MGVPSQDSNAGICLTPSSPAPRNAVTLFCAFVADSPVIFAARIQFMPPKTAMVAAPRVTHMHVFPYFMFSALVLSRSRGEATCDYMPAEVAVNHVFPASARAESRHSA